MMKRAIAALLTVTAGIAAMGWSIAHETYLSVLDSPGVDLAMPMGNADPQFENRVRAVLLRQPELIPQAMAELQKRETARVLDSYRGEFEAPFEGASIGPANATVTVVEFSDYRCPYCKRAHHIVQELLEKHPDVRLVVRETPVLDSDGTAPLSHQAATLALAAARQKRFAAMRNALYEIDGQISQETLVASVRQAGLNELKASNDMQNPDIARELARNIALARALGLSGTPAYVIGGRILHGMQSLSDLETALSDARMRQQRAE